MKTTAKRGTGIVILTVGLLTVGSAWRSSDAATDPALISTDTNVFGNSYGEWAARWTQWLLSIPAGTNPANDTSGANCAQGQAGPVWFLAGNFGGIVNRTCTVPEGKALFFPLVDAFFGAGAGDCVPTNPDVACDLVSLREGASAAMDPVNVTLATTIDGKVISNLTDQRVQSPVFLATFPENSVTGFPAGTYNPNVVDGYWLMLAPLKTGVHTLSFSAKITGGPFNGFSVGPVTYTLTISP